MLARPPRARACAAHRPHAPAGRCAAPRCRIPQPCRRGRGPGRLLRQAGRHPRLVGGGPARARRGRRGLCRPGAFHARVPRPHRRDAHRLAARRTDTAQPWARGLVRISVAAAQWGRVDLDSGTAGRREWDTEIGAREHFQVADDEHLFGSFIGVFTQPGPVQAWLAERVSQIDVFHLPSCGDPKLKCAAG